MMGVRPGVIILAWGHGSARVHKCRQAGRNAWRTRGSETSNNRVRAIHPEPPIIRFGRIGPVHGRVGPGSDRDAAQLGRP